MEASSDASSARSTAGLAVGWDNEIGSAFPRDGNRCLPLRSGAGVSTDERAVEKTVSRLGKSLSEEAPSSPPIDLLMGLKLIFLERLTAEAATGGDDEVKRFCNCL